MKSKSKLKTLTISALFCAAVFVSTAYLPRLPIAGGQGGYVHIGDAFIFLASSLLPMPFAALSAAVGSAMADALTGFMIWAPGTFVIKALMTVPFTSKKKMVCLRNVIAVFVATLILCAAYYVYEAVVITNFVVAAASIPFNLIQGIASSVIFLAVACVLDRIGIKKYID